MEGQILAVEASIVPQKVIKLFGFCVIGEETLKSVSIPRYSNYLVEMKFCDAGYSSKNMSSKISYFGY